MPAPARPGLSRPDVARTLGRADLANAGFRALIEDGPTAARISLGSVCPTAIRVVGPDGRSFGDLPFRREKCEE